MSIIPTRNGDMSDQAKQFLLDSISAQWETVDLSPTGVALLRAENSEVAKSGWDSIQSQMEIKVEKAVIDGVDVLWVYPRCVGGDEVVLYLYGGGFVCGCPEDDLAISARLADWMGRRVCVPRYRLSPEYAFPAARDDVMKVYRSVSEFCDVIVVGQSAGGNLGLGLVLDVLSEGMSSPLAVALLSPWIDLGHSGESHRLTDLDPTLSVEHFLTPASLAYMGEQSADMPDISPLFRDIPIGFPPTTISTGTRDLLFSDCTRLADKLHEKNISVDLQITEGMWHVYEWDPTLPESSISLQHIASFLSNYLSTTQQEQ